ncbi:cadherin-like domain-containing protein, partial [Gammaproteobacteria bacterium]|nr:cadherin-like domain-containing protein [Gammaproteobacteria bacterium]
VYQVIGGTVLDGYIRGAEVFVDRNNNLTLDSNESSVTTDNNGAFSNLRMYDGNLVTKNGTDLDTGFILENFSLQAKTASDKTAYIVSPVTTIGAYLSNPADVNNILGISSDIDVYSVDPIPLLDDAKHAALYSIGNRLTVLAMSIQKFEGTNKDLNAYLNVIATEAQTSYDASAVSVQVDDPDFVRSVLNTALGTSTADDFKSNLSTMLSNSLYLLQVKDNSAATTGIQNFAFTTLQDDITKLKNCSSASSCAVMNNYTNDVFGYVAGDQNLALSDVTIPIQAFDDVLEVNEDTELSFLQATLLANDNYLKGTGNTFVFTNTANGSFLSADAGSFRYLPNLNFNGADTFSYTIGQAGEESTGTVTINVAPVNDNPIVIARDFLSIGGGTAVFNNVGANDIDGDALSYTIGGTDAQYISVAGNGDLSFTNAVSYASPSDGNGDNIYEFTVAVSDGGTSVTQSFQVEVKPGGSAPVYCCVTLDPRFYANSPISIEINVSDPDGDAMSLSISNPSGFSIASNANGFEITNSSGLAVGSYTVEGVITDNNFNTPFSFIIEVIEDIQPGLITLLYKQAGNGVKVDQTDQRLGMTEINRRMRFLAFNNNVCGTINSWSSGCITQNVQWYQITPSFGAISDNTFTINVENPHQFSVTFGGGSNTRSTTGLLAQMGGVVPAVNDLVNNILYSQYLEMNIDRDNDFDCSGGGSVSTRTSADGKTEIFGDFNPVNGGYKSSCTFSFTIDYAKKVQRSKQILDTFLNGIPAGCTDDVCLYPPVFHDVFGALEADSDGEGLTALGFDIVARNDHVDGSNGTLEVNGGSGDGFTVSMGSKLELPYLDRRQDGYKQVEVILDDPSNEFEDNYSTQYIPYIDLKIDNSTFVDANREFTIKFITETQNGEWEVNKDLDKPQIRSVCDSRWLNSSEEVSEKCLPVQIVSIDDDSVTFKVKEYAYNGVVAEYNQAGTPPIFYFNFTIELVNKSSQANFGNSNAYLIKLELDLDS